MTLIDEGMSEGRTNKTGDSSDEITGQSILHPGVVRWGVYTVCRAEGAYLIIKLRRTKASENPRRWASVSLDRELVRVDATFVHLKD